MANHTVNDDVINSDVAEAYFSRADPRITAGLRVALEMLGIPVPLYAVRRKPGRTPAGDVLKAFTADNPQPRPMVLAPRKPNYVPPISLSPEGSGLGLFNETFG